MNNSFSFYQQALMALFGSSGARQGLLQLFAVLRRHMPVDALTFDSLSPNGASLFVHFIITRRGMFDLRHQLPLDERDKEYLQTCLKRSVVLHINHSTADMDLGLRHMRRLAHRLPLRDRAYMAAPLEKDRQPLGYVTLLGREAGCFHAGHAHMLEMLAPACACAMVSMLCLDNAPQDSSPLPGAGFVSSIAEGIEETALLNDMVGAQSGLRHVMESVRQLAHKDTPVLILGETGTGKELVANAIQKYSARADKPFIKVNCGALADTLLDSELFGHERGAFTGAQSMRQGRFEQADGGTLFLDEVGELSPQAQVRLLRVLQDGTFERMGGRRPITVDVRIMAATNRDLGLMCRQGLFREDLFHRLNVFPIYMPPLRQRRDDIPLLISFLAERVARRLGIATPGVHMHRMDRLMRYSWPGNVRELQNLVERALIVHPRGPLDIAPFLPSEAAAPGESASAHDGGYGTQNSPARAGTPVLPPLAATLGHAEGMPPRRAPGMPQQRMGEAAMRAQICDALKMCNGKVYGPGGAAEMLGLNHNTLRSRMRKLGIEAAAVRRLR